MHRLIAMIACVAMLFSLAGGSVAHAMEPIGCVEAPAKTGVDADHVDGDTDQVPMDGEKGYPHHHGGCHGHHIAAPVADAVSFDGLIPSSAMRMEGGDRHTTSGGDPALRPPQA